MKVINIVDYMKKKDARKSLDNGPITFCSVQQIDKRAIRHYRFDVIDHSRMTIASNLATFLLENDFIKFYRVDNDTHAMLEGRVILFNDRYQMERRG